MEFKENKLPIIYLDIDYNDQDTGVNAISFVDAPATEIMWEKFNTVQRFEKNKAKRVVTGPVMLAETPIKRISPTIGEYFVKFSKATIFDMMKKYFKQNKIHTVNEDHNPKRVVNNVIMIESFIVGDRIKSELYPDLPEGTWMASFFIESEDYWNDVIMSDEFAGFSLEGMFSERMEEEVIEETYNAIEEILNSNISEEEKYEKINKILKK